MIFVYVRCVDLAVLEEDICEAFDDDRRIFECALVVSDDELDDDEEDEEEEEERDLAFVPKLRGTEDDICKCA